LVRKKIDITQSELAKKAHVSQQAISRLENEKHIPNMDILLRIVDGLGLKLVLTER
jgi:DNA-binding XRE family transcriptional regulator